MTHLSIIIPVFNDSNGLEDTLQSLIGQNYSKRNYEIIVVDNRSTDNTLNVANNYVSNHPSLVHCFTEGTVQSSYAARNKGIKKASGSLISFIDANVIVENDFIYKVNKYFEENSVDYLGNKIEILIKNDNLSSRYNRMTDFTVDTDIRYNHYAPTCCLTVKSCVFDKVGIFDQRVESGGDWDFGQRIFNGRLIQHYTADIVVYHPARSSYISLINKAKRIARGIAQLSHYNNSEYNHLFKRYFLVKRYFPNNPLKVYKKYKLLYVETTYVQALIYSVFHIPIRIISFFSLVIEKIRLRIKKS